MNITDNDAFDDRMPNHLSHDDESEDAYLTAYHQLLQTHQQQQQQMIAQQEQENMLSTIFEASCEEATPMTSMVDVHQQRTQVSPPPIFENDDDDDDDQTEDEEREEEIIHRHKAPSFGTIDDIPVSTQFSKNDGRRIIIYFSPLFDRFSSD